MTTPSRVSATTTSPIARSPATARTSTSSLTATEQRRGAELWQQLPRHPRVQRVESGLPRRYRAPTSSAGRRVHPRRALRYLIRMAAPRAGRLSPSTSNGNLTWNNTFKMDVPLRCTIPSSIVNTGTVVPSGTGTYGHGLLGSLNQINATVEARKPDQHRFLRCQLGWLLDAGRRRGHSVAS